jgi:uncharacterized protein (TIGR03083 family)
MHLASLWTTGHTAVVSAKGGTTRETIEAIDVRSRSIAHALRALSTDDLHQGSELPEWSRLNIVCHLRFGAEALIRMTRSALQDLPVAYYPEGRDQQRPLTLVPQPGESPQEVVESFAHLSGELAEQWSSLPATAWDRDVAEPPENPDLGRLPLPTLPILRLTEVEVHGGDLGLNLTGWSTTFVHTILPMRLEWLNVRRVNHRALDGELVGSWLLVATDGPTYKVEVDGPNVAARSASPGTQARAVIEANSRDLLALLLGRTPQTPPVMSGDIAFARAFSRSFPGP